MRMVGGLRVALVALVVIWVTGCAAGRPALAGEDPKLAVLDALNAELVRNQQRLKVDDNPPPYFISYEFKKSETHEILAKFGAIYASNRDERADLRVEVRVGSYEDDNTGKKDLSSYLPFEIPVGLPVSSAAPIDDDPLAMRASLWLLTDDSYKKALYDYLQKKGKAVFNVKKDDPASFSREEAVTYIGKPQKLSFDAAKWEDWARRISLMFKEEKNIPQGRANINATHTTRVFVSTEGARIADETVLYSLVVDAEARAEDGKVLTGARTFYFPDEKHTPSWNDVEKEVRGLMRELLALAQATEIDPYSGPAMLSPKATAVLFHEAVGHRLEGERQMDDEEGRTFKGKEGQRILPEFLSLWDDPTLTQWNGIPLNGYYLHDNEGVKAQRTVLVDHGVLKTYLMSRTPNEYVSKSNGHGRAARTSDPIGRMGNTLVVSDGNKMSLAALKAKLLEEVQRQGKPYGLYIEDLNGGDTNTSSYGYQAFRITPNIVYRVWPDGREELVRGVEMVGTPINTLNKIVATSEETDVFNGFCGAESGYVPVSAVAPAVLLTEVELQRKKEESTRPPILPSPFQKAMTAGP